MNLQHVFVDSPCDGGWKYFASIDMFYCYTTTGGLTQADADGLCYSLYRWENLVSMETDEEITFVRNNAQTTRGMMSPSVKYTILLQYILYYITLQRTDNPR